MIVVWNCDRGETFGFLTLDDYKKFAIENEGKGRTCWEDSVYDVGNGGGTHEFDPLDMIKFNNECYKITEK